MTSTPKLTVFAALTAFALTTTGCNDDAGGMMPDPTDPAPEGPSRREPKDPSKPAPIAHYAGVYDAVAPLDFTQSGVLPGLLGPALAGLVELHDRPGKAIITIVENAGIPYLSEILMQVPSFLKGALTGLLDSLILDNVYKNVPVVDQIAFVIQGISDLGKQTEIHDQITVSTPTQKGAVQIEQQLSGVGFTLSGKKIVVDLSTEARAKALARMNGRLDPRANRPVADADLTIDSGTVSIPIGDLLLQAAGPLVFSQFGGAVTLKGALTQLVPCMDFAKDVSEGLGGIVSESNVQKLCVGAIGLIADQVDARIRAVTLDGVTVDDAKGKLLDVSTLRPKTDYQSDRLAEGTWTFVFTVNARTVAVPSSFSGDRIASAP